MLARSFSIESSSKLLVTRTGINAHVSFISGRIRLLTLELFALKWRKFYTFELEYLWGQWPILIKFYMCSITGVGERLQKVLGQIGSKPWFPWQRKPHWLIMGKMLSIPFLGCCWPNPFSPWTQVSDRCPLGYLFVSQSWCAREVWMNFRQFLSFLDCLEIDLAIFWSDARVRELTGKYLSFSWSGSLLLRLAWN